MSHESTGEQKFGLEAWSELSYLGSQIMSMSTRLEISPLEVTNKALEAHFEPEEMPWRGRVESGRLDDETAEEVKGLINQHALQGNMTASELAEHISREHYMDASREGEDIRYKSVDIILHISNMLGSELKIGAARRIFTR